MSRVIVLAHKRTVGSGSELAKAIGAKCIVPKYSPRGGFKDGDTLINWGVGSIPAFSSNMVGKDINLINPFLRVRGAINKAKALLTLQDKDIPSLRPILDNHTAIHTLDNSRKGTKMFARSLLCGSQGDGIDIYDDVSNMLSSDLNKYKMFTLGFPKNREFRVHVVNGEVVDYAQKKRMKEHKLEANGVVSVDRDIRSHKRGWVFTKVKVEDHPQVRSLAIAAVEALGLNFGAVDILAVVKKGQLERAVVCEVNTAPSLSAESTLNAYVKAFSK